MRIELQRLLIRDGFPVDKAVIGNKLNVRESVFARWQITHQDLMCYIISSRAINYACEYRKFRCLKHMYIYNPKCEYFGEALLKSGLFGLAEAWLRGRTRDSIPCTQYNDSEITLLVKHNRNEFIMEHICPNETMFGAAIERNNDVIFRWVLENHEEGFVLDFIEGLYVDDDYLYKYDLELMFRAFDRGLADYLTDDEVCDLLDYLSDNCNGDEYMLVSTIMKHFPKHRTLEDIRLYYRNVICKIRDLVDDLPEFIDVTLGELCGIEKET